MFIHPARGALPPTRCCSCVGILLQLLRRLAIRRVRTIPQSGTSCGSERHLSPCFAHVRRYFFCPNVEVSTRLTVDRWAGKALCSVAGFASIPYRMPYRYSCKAVHDTAVRYTHKHAFGWALHVFYLCLYIYICGWNICCDLRGCRENPKRERRDDTNMCTQAHLL